MRLSADWCHPKPEHPLQAVARPWLHWMHERKLVPQIVARVRNAGKNGFRALQLPCPQDMSPEAGQPYRLHLL